MSVRRTDGHRSWWARWRCREWRQDLGLHALDLLEGEECEAVEPTWRSARGVGKHLQELRAVNAGMRNLREGVGGCWVPFPEPSSSLSARWESVVRGIGGPMVAREGKAVRFGTSVRGARVAGWGSAELRWVWGAVGACWLAVGFLWLSAPRPQRLGEPAPRVVLSWREIRLALAGGGDGDNRPGGNPGPAAEQGVGGRSKSKAASGAGPRSEVGPEFRRRV
jgi:hypothetical protein